jgi:uncharacterized surface protein with fasciclin (FAS1) repeats
MTSRRILMFGGAAVALAGCGGSPATQNPAVTQQRDVATVLASDSTFERFVDGLRRTGTDTMLRGAGPFTVFAPTNSGWGSIPAQIRNDVLPPNGPADPVRGRALMAAHIVEGRHSIADLTGKRTTFTTVNGNRIIVDGTNPSNVTVVSDGGGGFNAGGGSIWGRSSVTGSELVASNGIVHAVDKAVLP